MNKRIKNERIKQLLIQAGGQVTNSYDIAENESLEKFAELIVRECAILATAEYNSHGAIHGNDLFEHFGIK